MSKKPNEDSYQVNTIYINMERSLCRISKETNYIADLLPIKKLNRSLRGTSLREELEKVVQLAESDQLSGEDLVKPNRQLNILNQTLDDYFNNLQVAAQHFESNYGATEDTHNFLEEMRKHILVQEYTPDLDPDIQHIQQKEALQKLAFSLKTVIMSLSAITESARYNPYKDPLFVLEHAARNHMFMFNGAFKSYSYIRGLHDTVRNYLANLGLFNKAQQK